jgi:poly-gamma-glutamate synthase PgsB/CapB
VILLLLLFLGWCTLLGLEAARLRRRRAAIPLRISVTGTRGKTTLVRALASVFREDGRRVVAKATGSEPSLILPDGSEERIRRRGKPSILEQVEFLGRAAGLGAEIGLAEIMSVHAENHRVESRKILQPHIVLVVNFRPDHVAAAGPTREEVARLHLLDLPPGATVFVPEGEITPFFRNGVQEVGATLMPVPRGEVVASPLDRPQELDDLVRAVALNLGVEEGAVRRGLDRARGDKGRLSLHHLAEDRGGELWCASAFAANDPESTEVTLRRVRESLSAYGAPERTSESGPLEALGILNLRRDRGDRTHQWVQALEAGALGDLGTLYLCGFHAAAACRRLRRGRWKGRVKVLKEENPAAATASILAAAGGRPSLVFGFGNMGGLGEALVDHWRRTGTPVMEESHGV